MPTRPVPVAGELWAPYLTGTNDLVMQRLDEDDAGNWVEVARFSSPEAEGIKRGRDWYHVPVLQGVAVVDRTILLSFYPSHVFFTFNCSTLTWNTVATQQKTRSITPPLHPYQWPRSVREGG